MQSYVNNVVFKETELYFLRINHVDLPEAGSPSITLFFSWRDCFLVYKTAMTEWELNFVQIEVLIHILALNQAVRIRAKFLLGNSVSSVRK